MTTQHPSGVDLSEEGLVSAEERKRITSGVRVTTALMVVVILIVASLTSLIFVLVSQVFESMTPAAARDLEWKTVRGAIELSKTAELGLVVHDPEIVRGAAADYLASPDVAGILAENSEGRGVLSHGPLAPALAQVFALSERQVHARDGFLMAWSGAAIEGSPVGRVAIAVSTERLRAGEALKQKIFAAAVGGGLVAVALALGFVALYIWPVLRVTQAAFVRLEHTTHMALQAARTKAQFLANMSHEIRTPMNAVVGLAKLMLGMPLAPRMRRYAEMIDASSRALLGIINDVLDFSKIEAGKYKIVRSPCEVVVILQEVAELLAERAHSKGIDLVYRVAPNVPRMVEADGDRVRQVLMNLVGNAIKFTEHGEVYIQLTLTSVKDGVATLCFRVDDSGIGVPAELKEHIFDAFSQADGSLVRKHGGTGLGLAISKQLVLLMDGAISLESEEGKGSSFWFEIPARVEDETPAIRAQVTSLGKRALIACTNEHVANMLDEHSKAWGMETALASDAAEASRLLRERLNAPTKFDIVLVAETQNGLRGEALVSELKQDLKDLLPPVVLLTMHRSDLTRSELDSEIVAQLALPVRMSELYECLSQVLRGTSMRPQRLKGERDKRSFTHARVLVVDDNEMNQFVAVEQLRRFGCQIDQAFNGEQALRAALEHRYDLILMDCQMPVMDGYTATRKIREAEPPERHTVIVALTAHALEGERDKVLSAGMDDYLTKPVRPQTLQRTLERWIKEHAATAQSCAEDALPHPAAPDNDVDDPFADCSTELLKLFLERVPAQLELLDGALAAADGDEVRAHAHKLKGSLLTVSATHLAQHAETMQHLKDEEWEEGERLFAEIMQGFSNLEKRVKHELAERARAAKRRANG